MNRPVASFALSIMAGAMVCLPLVLILTASTAWGDIYTWKDSRGTSHYVNSEYDIPERYRSKARVLDLGDTRKNGRPSGAEITPAEQGVENKGLGPIPHSRIEAPRPGRSRLPGKIEMRRDNSREE